MQKSPHRLRAPLLLALVLTVNLSAWANSAAWDRDVRNALRANDTARAESLVKQRLASQALDADGLYWAALMAANDSRKRDSLLKDVEACVAATPKAGRCHHAYGILFGAKVMGDGMMGAMRHAGKIRDAFQKAVELDPKDADARRSLNQYYSMAPAIAGGGVAKAFANADDFAKVDPYRGALLRVEIHAREDEIDKAEALLQRLPAAPDADAKLAEANAMAALGWRLVEKDPPRALNWFDRALKIDANSTALLFGRGRALLQQKQYDAALAVFEGVRQRDPKYPVEFRMGASYEGKGDKANAIAQYEAFVKRETVSERQRKQAQERIAALRAS
jgi:tetratricopeptide (TPR) repeat protein